MAQTNVQAFSGDVDISSNLAVDTNKLFVDSVGNKVGIGTTNPGLPLEVLTGNGANYGLRLRRGSGAAFTDLGHLSTPGTEGLAFNVSDGISTTQEVMRITGTGNVGIGTDTPGAKMDIYTGSTSTVGLSFDRYASGNYRTDIYQNTYGLDFRLGYAANTPESVLYLKRLSDGSKEVEINGNVGVGVANPVTNLDVAGSANGDQSLQLRSGDDNSESASSQIIFSYGGNPYNSSGYAHSIRTRHNGAADNNNAIDFWLWNNTDTADGDTLGNKVVMTLEGTGNVGIGRTIPLSPLDIKAKKGILTAASLDNLYSNATVMITGHAENADALCIGMLSTDTGGNSGNNPYAYMQNVWDEGVNILAQPILLNPGGGNVGIGTTDVRHRLDVGDNSGDCRLGFGPNIAIDNNRGVYWSTDGGYAIKRDSGAWSAPNYAQLRLQWATGIVLDAGGGTYGRSYVGVNDRVSIGSTYYNSNTKPPDNGLLVEGRVAIATNTDAGHTLNVNGRAFANHLQSYNYFYVYTNIGADGNWRTAFNIGTTAIGFFTVLSNNAGYGQPSAIWWYQYKSSGTTGYVSRISGSTTPNFRLSGQAVQSQGSGQQFVQVRTLPVSN